jgi:hypothetical protein
MLLLWGFLLEAGLGMALTLQDPFCVGSLRQQAGFEALPGVVIQLGNDLCGRLECRNVTKDVGCHGGIQEQSPPLNLCLSRCLQLRSLLGSSFMAPLDGQRGKRRIG